MQRGFLEAVLLVQVFCEIAQHVVRDVVDFAERQVVEKVSLFRVRQDRGLVLDEDRQHLQNVALVYLEVLLRELGDVLFRLTFRVVFVDFQLLPLVYREGQQGPAVLVDRLDPRAVADQQLNRLDLLVNRRQMEGGPPHPVGLVDLHVVLDEFFY